MSSVIPLGQPILVERDVGEFALNIKSTNGIETKVTLSIDQKKKRGE